MKLQGPDRYGLAITPTKYGVLCPKGRPHFSGWATKALPKLYVVSSEGYPVYIGITKQSMNRRLSYGFNAKGANGYYGYAWRHKLTEANIDMWTHVDAVNNDSCEIETVEAELVFLIRQAGQWPRFQTEIHFHESEAHHREAALQIASHYDLGKKETTAA